jgi:thiamine biosynthesis lipoprotein
MAATTRFSTWGTYVFLGVGNERDLEPARDLAEAVLAEIDRTCSRFREDSDLTRVNAAPGTRVVVDPLLAAAVAAGRAAAEATGGLVDPLLGRDLVHLGYDRDFASLRELPDAGPWSAPAHRRSPDAWREIEVDPEGMVAIPPGTALDLGATAKAWAADAVVAAVSSELGDAVVISVGGDVRIDGEGTLWPIGIGERVEDEPDEVVELDRGGLATSSTRVRRWTRGGTTVHHLLDPRTGCPAPEVWRTVTATGPTCLAANVASTAAVVLGEDAPDWLDDHGVSARLVAVDGTVLRLGAWPGPATVTEGGAA